MAKALAALAGSAPETLDTLKELADALGNDPNFATTVLNKLAEKLAKDQNGADIPDPALFVKNLGLKEAAKRDVGNGANQIPDMSFFAAGATANGIWFRQPGGIYVQSVECVCPGTDPAGYRFQLPTSFPTQFVGAVLTPKDGIGDITVSPTYLPAGLNAIQIYNFSGGDNSITALCFGY